MLKHWWMWARVQWRLARLAPEWKMALRHCQAMFLSAKGPPPEEGTQITLWVFPDESVYGTAAAMMPITDAPVGLVDETTTSGPAFNYQTVWRFHRPSSETT